MLYNNISHIQKLAESNFSKFGELTPVMFGVYKKPETGETFKQIMPLIFEDPEDKDALTNYLSNEIRFNNLKEYVLILESWMTSINKEKGIQEKFECVMMVYSSAAQEKVYMSNINRHPDELGDWKSFDSKNMEGRFLGLFKKAVAEWN